MDSEKDSVNDAIQFILDCDEEALMDLAQYLGVLIEDASEPDKDVIKIEIREENNTFNFSFESYNKLLAIKGSLMACVMKDPNLSNKIIDYAIQTC